MITANGAKKGERVWWLGAVMIRMRLEVGVIYN